MVDATKYQRLVGKMIYLSHSCPDLIFAVSVVSRFMHSPHEKHLKAVYMILIYLKRTPGKGLSFKKDNHIRTEAFTDADWARSTSDR